MKLRSKELVSLEYARSKPGGLVADLDSQPQLEFDDSGAEEHEELTRLQRLFTSPIDLFIEAWAEAAKMLSPRKRGGKKRGSESD